MSADLTFVLPTINEAGNIGPLVQALRDGFSDCRVLVIDGNSADETVAEAEAQGAKVLTEDGGYAASLLLGLREAETTWVMVMDADGSHTPDDAVRLWQARAETDLVVGSRFAEGGGSDATRVRWALSRWLAGLFGWLVRLPARDVSTGFRLYRRECFKNARPSAKYFEIQPALLAYAKSQNLRVKEIGIHYHPRKEGRSKARVFRYGVAFLRELWRLRRERKRSARG